MVVADSSRERLLFKILGLPFLQSLRFCNEIDPQHPLLGFLPGVDTLGKPADNPDNPVQSVSVTLLVLCSLQGLVARRLDDGN
jgi:hypothetical protein